jgi:ribosomal protein S27AE
MDDLSAEGVKQGVKWSAERSDDAPSQQPMRQATKPIQRRQPSADQKKVRRQMAQQQRKTAASPWDPEPQRQPEPERQRVRVKTIDRPRTEFQPRDVTDDADFDPYLVQRCEHGGKTTGDRKSQEVYINFVQQCHNEAHHPDARRGVAHARDHRADYSNCWSCCPDEYIAKPGERESGRIASLHRLASAISPPPCPECGSPGRDEGGMGATTFGHVETPGHCKVYTWTPEGKVVARDASTKAERDARADAFDARIRALNPFTRTAMEAMHKGAPFAGYTDFDSCVKANSDKDDPEAYCGSIKHKVEGAKTAQSPGVEHAGDRECQACGSVGSPVLANTGPACSACGSYSLLKAPHQHPGPTVRTDYTRTSSLHEATRVETPVASADGRILINKGDQINTPTGQTVTVNNIRRHEYSPQHYYVDTDAGTTVVPYDTKFTVMPQNSQQQAIPDLGTPGGNMAQMPLHPGDAGSNQAPSNSCPSCGNTGTLARQGDKYRCLKCGYTEAFGGAGGRAFSDSPRQLNLPRQSSVNNPRGVIARHAAMVAGNEEETPL